MRGEEREREVGNINDRGQGDRGKVIGKGRRETQEEKKRKKRTETQKGDRAWKKS
ncbi:MAG: hypothetical protein ABW098_16515 [Candidatus Thiodiazotropha sp.]